MLNMVLRGKTTNQTGASLAVILFTYQPLPEIWKILSHPSAGGDFSITYIYFIMLGCSLGLTRAIYIWDGVWLVLEVWAVSVKGMLLSVAIVVANARLPAPFMTPLCRNMLIAFNIAILIYVSVLFAFLPRKKPVADPEYKEPTTRKDLESAV
jgi:hypothetical protein